MTPPRSLVAVVSLVAALACQPRGSAVQPGGDKPAGGGTVGGGNGDYAPLAPVTRAAEILPASTLVMFEVAGPSRIAEIIGRDALVAKFQPEYQKMAAEITKELGHDILDPKQLGAIGVDANGRMGVALLGIEPFSFAGWITLSDAGKFRAMIFDALARKDQQPKAMPLGGAEVVTLREGREWLVIRAPLAVFVSREGDDKAGGDPALAIASADPNRALSNDKDFRRATGRIAAADALTYVDGNELWRMIEGEMAKKNDSPPSGNWARDELAAAKQRGETKERIAELEKQAKEIDESNASWGKRQEAERELVKRLFAGMGTGTWSMSAKPGGIVGEGRLELGADSIILKVLGNGKGSAALPKAIDSRPLWMMTGAFDVNETIAFLDLAMRSEGSSWKEASSELKSKTGLDLDGDLRPLFSGTGGFALTLDGELGSGDDMPKKIGFGVDIELADAAKAQGVLDKLGTAAIAEMKKKPGKDQPKLRKDGKGWVVDVPKWRKVFVAIAGSHLVASTDAGLAKRIAAGDAGGGGKLAPPSAMAAASWDKAALGWMTDLELSMWMFAARSMGDFSSASIESPDDAKVPKSKAWKAKQKQIEAVDAKLKKARAKREAEELARFRGVTQPWGAMGGNVRKDGNAVVFSGGLFVRNKTGGIAGALMDSLTAVKALADEKSSVDTEMGKLFEERSKLEQEQREIRDRDLAKHRGKGGATVPPPPPAGG